MLRGTGKHNRPGTQEVNNVKLALIQWLVPEGLLRNEPSFQQTQLVKTIFGPIGSPL